MSLLCDALQPHIEGELFRVEGPAGMDFDTLIAKHGFTPAFENSRSVWTLDFRDATLVACLLAHDCSRLAAASFQTYMSVPDHVSKPEQIPWSLVRAYYAAFYGAHALLRALGGGCVWIDALRSAKLRQLLSIHKVSKLIDRGLYSLGVTDSGRVLTLRSLNGGSGGTHEGLWSVFIQRLKELEADVLSGTLTPSDAQAVFAVISGLRTIATHGSANDAWLSVVRNEVQYRQARSVWHPCQVKKQAHRNLVQATAKWQDDPMSFVLDYPGRDDLSAFMSACTFIVASCRAVLLRIEQRSPRRARSFARRGPLSYLEHFARIAADRRCTTSS